MRTNDRPGYLLVLPWELTGLGGVTQVVTGLYDTLHADARVVPYVLIPSWEAITLIETPDKAGRAVIRLRFRGLPPRGPSLLAMVKYIAALPAQLWNVRSLTRRYNVRTVNCHYIGESEITWALAKSLGLYHGKLILSVHGLDGRTLAALRGVRRRIWQWVLRRADAVVACSEALAQETVQAFDLPREHVVTIYNGVDSDRIAITAGSGNGPGLRGVPALLNLGTFEHKKGHDVLLRALPAVLAQYPDAHLTIMGRHGETLDATRDLVGELGLAKRVSLVVDQPREAALRALAAADLFVLSSRNEAFAMVLLEAGALGKPIVATDVCGVTELIRDGLTGTVVPPEDSEALAAGLLRALRNREKAAESAQRLRDRVKAQFTAQVNAHRYLSLGGHS